MEIIYTNTMDNPVGEVDFHIHTNHSDGENTCEEMIAMAKKCGLKVMAITDHNRFTMTEPILQDGLLVLPGSEISTAYPEETADSKETETKEIHVIGLFPKGVNPKAFDELLKDIFDGREAYIRAILDDLDCRGMHITYEEVKAVTPEGKGPGRHQIGLVLIQKGYAQNMTDAFDRHIGNFSPYFISSTKYIKYPPFGAVIQKIRECGGIPVLCHAFAYKFTKEEIRSLVRLFKHYAGDVAAIEVYYERYRNEPEKIEFLKEIAMSNDLLMSVGSDSHSLEQAFASLGTMKMFQDMIDCLEKSWS